MTNRYSAGLIIATVMLAFALHGPRVSADSADEPTNAPDSQAATPAPMNNHRLASLLNRLDENVQGRPGFWRASTTLP